MGVTGTPPDQFTLVKADNTNYNLHISNGGGSARGVLISGGSTGSDATLLQVTDYTNTNHFFTVTDGNSYFQNGKVGIGTTTPAAPFHVLNTAAEQFRLGYDATNYTSFSVTSQGTLVVNPTSGGISFGASVANVISNSGTSIQPNGNGATAFQIANTDATSGNTAGMKFTNGSGVVYSAIENLYTTRTGGAEDGTLTFTTMGAGTKRERMRITPSGSIVIGALDPHGFKLAVNGSAIATSMTVQVNSLWPDYVFKPDYKLPSLKEIKTYIDHNGHLPEIPSEEEVTQNGLNLGEMNKLLTKKVEELTLYLLEQNKMQKAQDERIDKLQKMLEQFLKDKDAK